VTTGHVTSHVLLVKAVISRRLRVSFWFSDSFLAFKMIVTSDKSARLFGRVLTYASRFIMTFGSSLTEFLTPYQLYADPEERLLLSVIPVTEVTLARAPRALEGEVRGGSSLERAGKGRLWRKGSRKEVYRGAQRVNALLSHLSCL
jgi:hypothetical protein